MQSAMNNHLLEYMLLAGLWTAYCILHSLLISPSFVCRVREYFPNGHRYHRLCFNLFAIFTLIPIAVYTLALKTSPLFSWDGPLCRRFSL